MAELRPRRGRIDPEHEGILERRYSALNDLNPLYITDQLIEAQLLSLDDYDEIEGKTTIKGKRDVLIQKMRYSGAKSFYKFLFVLHQTGYQHIAITLENELSERSIREYDEFKRTKTSASTTNQEIDEKYDYEIGEIETKFTVLNTKKSSPVEHDDDEKTTCEREKFCEKKENFKTKSEERQQNHDVSDCKPSELNVYSENDPTTMYQNTQGQREHIYTLLIRPDLKEKHTTEMQQNEKENEEMNSDIDEANYINETGAVLIGETSPIPCLPGDDNKNQYLNLIDQNTDEANTRKNEEHGTKKSNSSHEGLKSESAITANLPVGEGSCTSNYHHRTSGHSETPVDYDAFHNYDNYRTSAHSETPVDRVPAHKDSFPVERGPSGHQDRRNSAHPREIKLVQPLYLKKYFKPSSDTKTLADYHKQLKHIDGWYAGITEDNFCDVVKANKEKIGHYFIWYSKEKDTVIVTIINSPDPMHVKVKKADQHYYFRRHQKFDTVKDLIVHITHQALIEI